MTFLAELTAIGVAIATGLTFVLKYLARTWKLGPFLDQEQPELPPTLPPEAPKSPPVAPMPTSAEKIYQVAKLCLGEHLTLDSTVPADLGCAEAVSYVLGKAGLSVPAKGFQGTANLYTWLLQHPDFKAVTTPTAGGVVISPTGTSSKGAPHGHVGIVLQHGIGSNDSSTGLFKENYTTESWAKYFGVQKGFPVYYFAPVG